MFDRSEVTEYLDWFFSHTAFDLALIVILGASALTLAYGIFDGDPPLLKKKELSERARRSCLLFGSITLALFFFVLLPLPGAVGYLIEREGELLVNGRAVVSGTQVAVFDINGKRIQGPLELRLGEIDVRLPHVSELPGDWSAYEMPLRLVADDRDLTDTPLYVAEGETNSAVVEPLHIVDGGDRKLGRIKNVRGNFIFPEESQVVLLDTRILYRDRGGTERTHRVGARLDCDHNSCGGHGPLLIRHLEPAPFECTMIDPALASQRTSAGIEFDPTALVATSRIFPPGAVLLANHPITRKRVEVTVIGTTGDRCSLSPAAFEALGFEGGRPKLHLRVVDYLHQGGTTGLAEGGV